MKLDIELLPKKYGDDLRSARADFKKLSVESTIEVITRRRNSLIGRRQWGDKSTASFRISTGEVDEGHEPVLQQLTSTLETLAESLEFVGDRNIGVYGYGSVFDVGYVLYDAFGPYIETMGRNAFDSSLAFPTLQTSFMRSHEGLGLAHTLSGRMKMVADDHGLAFAASLNLDEIDARDVYEKLFTGSTSSQTSVGGMILDHEWNEEYTEVEIHEWSMSRGEISIVHAGANPAGWVRLMPEKSNVIEQNNLAVLDIMHYQDDDLC